METFTMNYKRIKVNKLIISGKNASNRCHTGSFALKVLKIKHVRGENVPVRNFSLENQCIGGTNKVQRV